MSAELAFTAERYEVIVSENRLKKRPRRTSRRERINLLTERTVSSTRPSLSSFIEATEILAYPVSQSGREGRRGSREGGLIGEAESGDVDVIQKFGWIGKRGSGEREGMKSGGREPKPKGRKPIFSSFALFHLGRPKRILRVV